MNTKNSITPWYQPQLRSYRIQYSDNTLSFYNHVKTEEINRKKAHSLHSLDNIKKDNFKAIELNSFKTIDANKHSRQINQTEIKK